MELDSTLNQMCFKGFFEHWFISQKIIMYHKGINKPLSLTLTWLLKVSWTQMVSVLWDFLPSPSYSLTLPVYDFTVLCL